MELIDYIRVLRERWYLVLGSVVLLVAAAAAVTFTATPTYRATSQLYVSVVIGDPTTQSLQQGSNYSQAEVVAFADLATSPLVLDPVIDSLGLRTSSGSLAQSITASATVGTPLIRVTVERDDPQEAALLSSAVAESMTQVIPELQRPEGAATSPVKLTITRYAEVPTAAASPSTSRNLALGGLLGLTLGVGLALLVHVLDSRVRSPQALAQLVEAPLLGTVSQERSVASQPLAMIEDSGGRVAEAVRQVRTSLQFVGAGEPLRSIAVTSAVPGEGKSTTATNLALSLAESGLRVLLVDGDLRRPSVAGLFGLEQAAGLTTVLVGRAEVADVVQRPRGSTLDVLVSGATPPNPSELLGSDTMEKLLVQLRESYDMVVVDSAPLLPVTDGAVLSKVVDGVLVVVGARVARRTQVRAAFETLELIGSRVLGVVLNGVSPSRVPIYEYYYVEARPGSSRKGSPARHSTTPSSVQS